MSTSYKFFLDELLAILKLREKNDGIKLAMVIMYARASKDDEVESIRKSINYFLSKQGEIQSNDILGIRIIIGEESILPCFGLAPLMLTWKKRRKTYRIEIKNSLIQIGKNKIREKIPNYISYYFERIIDVEKQEGISNDYTEKLQ